MKFEDLPQEYRDDLSKNLPIRIVLKKDPEKGYLGLVEESFWMDFSPGFVNMFWSGKAYSIFGEHILDGIKNAESHAKKEGEEVFDPLSDDCPVDIDWVSWYKSFKASKPKFRARNAPFKVKVP